MSEMVARDIAARLLPRRGVSKRATEQIFAPRGAPAVPACRRGAFTSVHLEESKNIDSSLEPLDEYIVIQPVSDETETRAGLILPASALSTVAVRTGIVTAVGSEPNGIERGDKVLYPHEAGYDVRLGGIEVKVLKRGELIGRIHD